jgi:branched-chain amino acid transport system ATP-binding protein
MTVSEPVLEILSLHAGYGSGDVLHGIHASVAAGELVCIIGSNTAGKSTLLRAISGLLAVRGSIRFMGEELIGKPAHAIPRLGIAHVPEGRHVFPEMTVTENVMLGGYAVRQNATLAARYAEILEMFPRLAERSRQRAGSLSGGEQQMVAIARALMLRPKLLLLDEPSHGLAPKLVDELHGTLGSINKSGASVLLVEQNTALALSVASRGYVLQSGRIVLSGSSADLANNSEVRKAYLGI